jgi:hypothetical protein
MAKAKPKRIGRKTPERIRKTRVGWHTPTLRVLLKRDKRSVEKDLSEEEIESLQNSSTP